VAEDKGNAELEVDEFRLLAGARPAKTVQTSAIVGQLETASLVTKGPRQAKPNSAGSLRRGSRRGRAMPRSRPFAEPRPGQAHGTAKPSLGAGQVSTKGVVSEKPTVSSGRLKLWFLNIPNRTQRASYPARSAMGAQSDGFLACS
jgi:hypothetical protein